MKQRSRQGIVILATIIAVSFVPLFAQNTLPTMKKRLQAAEAAKKDSDVRYWTNVIHLHQTLTRGSVEQVKCGKAGTVTNPDQATKDKLMDTLTDAALVALLPAFAKLLESPVGQGVALFVTPTAIARDAFQIIDGASTGDPNEVINASRRLLLDTNPAAMKQITPQRKALIYKCGHQVAG